MIQNNLPYICPDLTILVTVIRTDDYSFLLRGAIQKKPTKFWTLAKHGGGGQRPSQTFYQKMVWTCFKRDQRALSEVFFCKKVCFWVPEVVLCLKIIYILHASEHELQYHIPTQALSEKFHFLIYQKLIL